MESSNFARDATRTRSQENLVDVHLVVSAPGRALSADPRR
jgi:hypothetical protein